MGQHSNKCPLRIGLTRLIRWAVMIMVLPISIGVGGLRAESLVFSEDQVKAAYLFNLISFITWPETAFDSPTGPLRIAVFGGKEASSFMGVFRNLIKGERFQQRAIAVDQILPAKNPDGYHILFIAAYPEMDGPQLLEASEGRPILTVGNSPGFCEKGGMINLLRKGKRIGLEVNIARVRAANLKISSKLLRVATIVVASSGNGEGQ